MTAFQTGSRSIVCNVWSDAAREAALEARREHETSGQGQEPEDPIGDTWRRQASKMSKPKLLRGYASAQKFHQPGNKISELQLKVYREELAKRGLPA